MFDWRKRGARLAVAVAAVVFALLLIDRASLLIAPCGIGGSGYSEHKSPNDDNCAIREGIVVAGIEWLSDRPPEVWTALATIAVALFTGTLWLSNEKATRLAQRMSVIARRQMLISGQQTDIQRKQHALGGLQFLATHRPKLRIRHVILDESAGDVLGFIPWDHGDEIKGSLIVVNAGGTKATIIESRYRIFFTQTGLPAGEAPYDTTFNELLIVGQELDVGESNAIPLSDKIEMWGIMAPTEDGTRTLRRFEQENWSVYVMGQIRYRDEGGVERFMGFCRKRMRNGRYRPVKSPDYEYED
jgi:hypothetical protein